MSNERKLDIAWGKIFEKFNVLEEIKDKGYFIISADEIKVFYEPRLITKFDHSINLPEIFKKNHISILPINRGDYLLSNHQMFFEFGEDIDEIEYKILPAYIESIDKENITSETVALNSTYISGMLKDFLEDENIYPTVSGRMGSGNFTFYIKNVITNDLNKVEVDNSQIEIDGAYEGEKFLALVEAKRNISKDFLIRQIYYPYRTWLNKISKNIKMIYFVYSNGVYKFYEYKFVDPENYNSLTLVKQKKYTLEDMSINVETVTNILESTMIVREPEVPFPQADDFKKVINLCEIALTEELDKERIAIEYEFNIRQSDYYTNACRYLGLMEKQINKGRKTYRLTQDGINMLKKPYIDRQLFLVKKIVEHQIFHDVLKLAFQNGKTLSTHEINDLMRNYKLFNVGSKAEKSTTFIRRASTIHGWIDWILSILDE